MTHVFSFDTCGYSEYLTVEETLKRVYPLAKRFIRCNTPYVCCTCSIINEAVRAVVVEEGCTYPPVSCRIVKHRLDLYYLGEDKAEVWIYDCGCGTVYYNYAGDLKVRIKI